MLIPSSSLSLASSAERASPEALATRFLEPLSRAPAETRPWRTREPRARKADSCPSPYCVLVRVLLVIHLMYIVGEPAPLPLLIFAYGRTASCPGNVSSRVSAGANIRMDRDVAATVAPALTLTRLGASPLRPQCPSPSAAASAASERYVIPFATVHCRASGAGRAFVVGRRGARKSIPAFLRHPWDQGERRRGEDPTCIPRHAAEPCPFTKFDVLSVASPVLEVARVASVSLSSVPSTPFLRPCPPSGGYRGHDRGLRGAERHTRSDMTTADECPMPLRLWVFIR